MFLFQQPTHTAVSVCHITATREVLVCPVIPRKEKENLLLFNTCGLFFYNRGVKLIAGGPEKTLITVTPISIATEHYLNVLAVVMVMRPKVCDIICMPHTLNTKKQRTSSDGIPAARPVALVTEWPFGGVQSVDVTF